MVTSVNSVSKAAPSPLLKVREVAKVLTISRHSVKALIDSGDLDARTLHPSDKKMKRQHLRVTIKSLAKFYKKRFGQELDCAQPTQTAK